MSAAYFPGDVLDVEIVKIIPNGLGLAFAEKLTVFVPLSVAGDRLRVEIRQLKDRTAFASIIEVLEPSEARTEPPCEYFGECGGCDLQQMGYEAQLQAKSGIVEDSLWRIGKIRLEEPIEVIPSPSQFGYRLRSQFHADPASRKLGFYKRQSHEVIEVDKCRVLTPEMEDLRADLRDRFVWPDRDAETIDIEAAAASGGVSIFRKDLPDVPAQVNLDASGCSFRFDARAFFQANSVMAEQLIARAVGGFSGALALDLYCGIGLFTVPLSKEFRSVSGVESNTVSAEFAVKNAERAGAENVTISRKRVREFLRDDIGPDAQVDLVVVDPPRSGVNKSTLSMIISLRPANVSYVSCNPTTLARDIRILIDSGYRLDNVTALDLFPQTHHVETVARLSLG